MSSKSENNRMYRNKNNKVTFEKSRMMSKIIYHNIDCEGKNATAQETPDTTNRKNMHLAIIQMLQNGKSKLEILDYLKKEFSDSPKIIKDNFKNFIDQHAQKMGIKENVIQNKDDEDCR